MDHLVSLLLGGSPLSHGISGGPSDCLWRDMEYVQTVSLHQWPSHLQESTKSQ